MPAFKTTSTQPYLLRALYEWCNDNGLTPHIVVRVDDTVRVPHEYVQNGQIVLNIGFDATSGLEMGNDYIEFKARFGGIPKDIWVPVSRVLAIYARETGQGMAFPEVAPEDLQEVSGAGPETAQPLADKAGPHLVSESGSESDDGPDDSSPSPRGSGPSLRIIK